MECPAALVAKWAPGAASFEDTPDRQPPGAVSRNARLGATPSMISGPG